MADHERAACLKDGDDPLEERGKKEQEAPRGELVWRIAKVGCPQAPAVFVGFCQGIVPVVFIGRLKDTEMTAALGLCNVMMQILGFSWISGASSGINTFSSQDWGAGAYHNIGVTLQRGGVICMCFILPLVVVWLNSVTILNFMGQPPEVTKYVGIFTTIRIPGIFCACLGECIHRTLMSIGNTRISLATSIAAFCLNVAFHAALVPSFHFHGSVVALTLTDLGGATLSIILAYRDPDFRRCWGGFTWKAFHGWLPYLRVAMPSFVLLATEVWTFVLQDFLAGLISTNALAANAIAPQIVVTQYCFGASLSCAATTVIGNLLGEGRAGQARRAACLCVSLVLPCLIPVAIFVYFARQSLPSFFTEDMVVAKLVGDLLLVAQVFCIFDGHQAALTGIINGVGKQAVAAPLIFASYWLIGIPIGVVLAFGFFGVQPLGIFGLWYGMIVGVVLHALSFGVVVMLFNWTQLVEDVKERKAHEANDQGEYELAQVSARCRETL